MRPLTPDEALRYFTEKKTAYQLAFGSPAGAAVLADLTPFCRAEETCGVPGDHDRTWALIGRHEVYLRVRQYLDRTPEELVALNTRPAKGAISHDRPDTDA
jgi:hypothetical protein